MRRPMSHVRIFLGLTSFVWFGSTGCGDDAATPGSETVADTSTAETSVDTSVGDDSGGGTNDDLSSNDDGTAGTDVGDDTATGDAATGDVSDDDTAASGRCVGSGACSALDAATCTSVGQCTLATIDTCAPVACHELFSKDACGMNQPACTWNEEFQNCKYSDFVNCPSLTDMAACAATGGCRVDSAPGDCGGGNWDCDTLAGQQAVGYEQGCVALGAAGLGCVWEP